VLFGRSELTTLKNNDFFRVINFQKGRTYYAEGKDSKKSYGSKYISISSYIPYDVWHIY
jgi:hypothetical protein